MLRWIICFTSFVLLLQTLLLLASDPASGQEDVVVVTDETFRDLLFLGPLFGRDICHKTSDDEYETLRMGILRALFHKIFHRDDKEGSCGDLCEDLCGQQEKCAQVTENGSKCTCTTECDNVNSCSSDADCDEMGGVCQNLLCCATFECAETEETLEKLISRHTEAKESPFVGAGEEQWLYAKVYGSEVDAPVATASGGHLRNYIGQTYPPIEVTVSALQYVEQLKVTLKTIEDLGSATGMEEAVRLYEQKSTELSEAYEELVGVPYPGTLMDYLKAYNDNDLNWVPYMVVVKKGTEQNPDAPTYEEFVATHLSDGGIGDSSRRLDDSAEVCACPMPAEECQFTFSFGPQTEGCEEWTAGAPVVPATCLQGEQYCYCVIWKTGYSSPPTQEECSEWLALTSDFFKGLFLADDNWPSEYKVDDFLLELETFVTVETLTVETFVDVSFTGAVRIPDDSSMIPEMQQPFLDAYIRLWATSSLQEQYYATIQESMAGTPFAEDIELYMYSPPGRPHGYDPTVDCSSVFGYQRRRELGWGADLWNGFRSGCVGALSTIGGWLETTASVIDMAGANTMNSGITSVMKFRLQGNCKKRLEHVANHYFKDSSCQNSYLPSSFDAMNFLRMCKNSQQKCASPGHPPTPKQAHFYSDESGSCVKHDWVDQEGFEGDYDELEWCYQA